MRSSIRVRIAPSPTGFLHVGTARAALFNYLFAKNQNGVFVLRIEDTDVERSDKKYERNIFDGLRWLGIDPDEGPEQGGQYGPYRQSERTERYRELLLRLLEDGKAYACFDSKEDLMIDSYGAETKYGVSNLHPCSYRDLPFDPSETRSFVIRYKNEASPAFFQRMQEGGKRTTENLKRPLRTGDEIKIEPPPPTSADDYVHFDDEVRGGIDMPKDILGDFIVAKSLKEALYNFTVVVDDHDMEITHVIRGEDHISNTPKQILLIEALGFERPKYVHLPLILGSDRSKLSKRHGATSLEEYRAVGYLPEALFNFMTLLGWNPGGDQEIFSKEELIQKFSLEKVQKSGAIFDIQKLLWMNGEYIRKKSTAELTKLCLPYLIDFLKFQIPNSKFHIHYIERVVALEQPRLMRLSDIKNNTDYFFRKPSYDKTLLQWKNMTDAEIKESLDKSIKLIQDNKEKGMGELKAVFLEEAEKMGDRGKLLWPLRVALSGKKASPDPFEIIEILGVGEAEERLQSAIALIS